MILTATWHFSIVRRSIDNASYAHERTACKCAYHLSSVELCWIHDSVYLFCNENILTKKRQDFSQQQKEYLHAMPLSSAHELLCLRAFRPCLRFLCPLASSYRDLRSHRTLFYSGGLCLALWWSMHGGIVLRTENISNIHLRNSSRGRRQRRQPLNN